MKHPFTPDYAVPPGATLRETIESIMGVLTDAEMGEAIGEFARRARLDRAVIEGILDNSQAITFAVAAGLMRASGVSASFWLACEENYQRAKLAERRLDALVERVRRG